MYYNLSATTDYNCIYYNCVHSLKKDRSLKLEFSNLINLIKVLIL